MNKVNIHDAKTHLSEYIAALKEGESLILCRRNKPVAEIRLLPQPKGEKRPVGLAGDIFQVPESFFELLPEELQNLFEGRCNEASS
jgi:antitoxin (DNA-binding transcriptional repressor) of toxin-antitoxin stability system